ncbi:Tetratricopeptide repeat-containing protein [Aquiflexum balticum DSM 16537]|uniref:histidine kinase n=1 Tax=Aquiflexum balticum DSM 16537 TaxID=758820 RepID=A0A1W2H215_9BACT|nr:tetratricopeptide repeat-containing sensor histidine kinase [Aquiflexum balticum]SMD43007.1 Tetratricopeptide repeat-containing protein [Aquiflexum balticum DSM 16537]
MRKLLLSPILFLFVFSFGVGQDMATLLDSALNGKNGNELFFLKARNLIKSEDDRIQFLMANHGYYSSLNDRDSMMAAERVLIPLLETKEDKERLITVYKRIGYYYEVAGLYDQGIKYYLEALNHAENFGNPEILSEVHKSLSQIHRLFHDYDKAIEFGKRAFQVSQSKNNQYLKSQVNALNIIGAAFSEMNLPDSAINYYHKILELTPLLDTLAIAPTIVNIGYAYLLKGDIEQSRIFNKMGLNFYKKTNNDYAKSVVFINSGMTENSAQNYKEALLLLDSGLYYSQKSQYAEMYKWIYDEQYKIYNAVGNYPEAINSLVKLIAIKDSLFEADRVKVAKDLETKYQTALKDREIKEKESELKANQARFNWIMFFVLLLVVIIGLLIVIHFLNQNRFQKKQELLEKEKEIQIREAAIKAALASQEEEKKRFAKDLHDGFGQLITALRLNISGLNGQKNIEEKMALFEHSENILGEMHKEIRQIAFDMMPETLVQHGLLPALREFAQRLSSSGKIIVNVQAYDFEDRLIEIQEISLYRIIQEWCNNILKYSGATAIEIQLVNDEEELRLTIEDNGKGFDVRLLDESKGHGWKNINSRVKLIKGDLEIDSNPLSKGTTLILAFRPQIKSKDQKIMEK